jgi:KDO2-lipid IV(A) lauroyltransferase
VRRLPRRAVLALGRSLGRLWGACDRRHLAIAADNLRRAFPEWDERRVQRTARGVYAHFGTVLLDILWAERRGGSEILALADVEGLEHLRAAQARGRGVVCPTAHIGNWEYQGLASSLLVGPISVIARPLDNPRLDRRLVAFRTAAGNDVIYKQRALSRVMKALREGGVVAVLIDQNVQERDGIFVRFFGRPASTTTVAAAIALKTGCAIVPGYCVLQPGGRYRMAYGPPVEWAQTGRREEDVAGLTQHLTSIIEGWVRETPEQWLWLHRRWKTQSSRGASAAAGPEGSCPFPQGPDESPSTRLSPGPSHGGQRTGDGQIPSGPGTTGAPQDD